MALVECEAKSDAFCRLVAKRAFDMLDDPVVLRIDDPMPRGPNGRNPVNRIVLTLTVGLMILALQPSRAADREPPVSQPRIGASDVVGPIRENADCSKGTVEQRLDCLNLEIVDLKQRLEGKSVSVVPLVQ
jgi:hypothetical protein